MSKFVTSMAVEVESVKKLLPAKAFLGAVRFNVERSTVEIFWEDDNLVTPYTAEIEFPVEALQGRKLPKGVRVREDLRKERIAAEAKRKAELAAAELQRQKAAEERSAARKKVAIRNAQTPAAGATGEQTNPDNSHQQEAESKSCTTRTDGKRKSGT